MAVKVLAYGASGEALDDILLDVDVQKKDFSPKTYSCAVRTMLQNWRQGTVKCKDRGEVSFSNKKPWKQKGTGRARAGSARSPLWRKGGVIFGPQPRTRMLTINKKQKKLVLNNVLFSALENKAVSCLDFLIGEKPSTKNGAHALRSVGFDNKKVILFLPFDDSVSHASFRNIPNVNILFFDQPNVFDLSDGECWVFFKRDLDLFKEMVSRWN